MPSISSAELAGLEAVEAVFGLLDLVVDRVLLEKKLLVVGGATCCRGGKENRLDLLLALVFEC